MNARRLWKLLGLAMVVVALVVAGAGLIVRAQTRSQSDKNGTPKMKITTRAEQNAALRSQAKAQGSQKGTSKKTLATKTERKAAVHEKANGDRVEQTLLKMRSRTTQAEQKAAAMNKRRLGLTGIGAAATRKSTATTASVFGPQQTLAEAPAALAPLPGDSPDYFGPYSNWGLSPLPQGPINPDPLMITITNGGGGYDPLNAPLVTIGDVYGFGTGATATASVDEFGQVTAITLDNTGSNNLYVAPIVTIAPPCEPMMAGCDTATASVTIAGATEYTGGLRKFVDTLPSLVIATPDIVTYPGTDYYEIELAEYTNWKFHTNLDPTRLRGYRQLNMGTNTTGCAPEGCTSADNTVAAPTDFSYLGPTIVAVRNRPTRIKFTNNLPLTGAGGELFIPTDTTVMGAGMGYDGNPDPDLGNSGPYSQNRGTLHLHGGFTPWVSDGTPHQWVTPAGEATAGTILTTGVSTQPVPDMDLPAGNSMTFYWPNQQSGRLMFYHDHAYGITRVNVYAGEAAGYLLVDGVERALTDGTTTVGATTIPAMADVPLVIQDKTFVWGSQGTPTQSGTGTWATDPTWNWGTAPGSLWFPHVYMPNQNPWDISGANAMGRWDYALWFWPPYNGLLNHGLLPNPYCLPTPGLDCSAAPWEAPFIPGTPPGTIADPNAMGSRGSIAPEAFMDTPIVNGKAYPTMTVDPKPYRLRILNACNDRFLNLSFFLADSTGTEVTMVPFNSSQNRITPFPTWWYTAGTFTFDDRRGGVPDPRTRGPAMLQIGTEGGLLPAPALVRNQPVNYTYDRGNIVVLSVQEKALFLGTAERADVVVDFSTFAGKTLILYNDAPAPVPAGKAAYDYYTGGDDLTDMGGAPPTLPGYGPNTRTVMQIVVGTDGGSSTAPKDYYNPAILSALNVAVPAAFAASQDPIVVPQVAYNPAYPSSPTASDVPGRNVSRISDTSLTFTPLFSTTPLPITMGAKAIQELFELDYGRMNATLGVELPFSNAGNQTTLPMGYIDPATEIIDPSSTIAPPAAGDGTQIWKITHNGVDTHAIHFHLFNVQVINRVGWDGAIRRPDPNELGWKETVRMNPLEDIIVAMRPTTPKLPFGLPDSSRLMDVTTPPGSSGQFAPFDEFGNPVLTVNAIVNFGWEYVWHCHLLGHEENDMMRPTVFNALRALPAAPTPLTLAQPVLGTINLTWTDSTPFNGVTPTPPATLGDPANEIGFRIERVIDSDPPVVLGTTPLANATTFTDTPPPGLATYSVIAFNAAGDSPSATSSIQAGLLPPSGLTATAVSPTQIDLTWVNNEPTADGIEIWRGGTLLTALTLPLPSTFSDTTVTAETSYSYYLIATSPAGNSGRSNTATAVTPLRTPTLTLISVGNDAMEIRWGWGTNSTVATQIEIWRCQAVTAGCFFSRLTTVAVDNVDPNGITRAFLDDPVDDGATFSYYVIATSTTPANRSANSNTVTGTTPLFPPTNLVKTTATTTSITMSWTIGSGNLTTATGFYVERAPGSSSTWAQIAVVPASTGGPSNWTYTNTGLTKNTTYSYRVQAYKTTPASTSAYTNKMTATTLKK